ncbi:AmmeMemoRadiSam system radical SAM enzyme [Thermostilla marina]
MAASDRTPTNLSPSDALSARWQHREEGTDRIVCDLCPRACRLPPGAQGFCFVRKREGDRIVSTTYGRSTGFCVDPIEKKPLNHFYPGTAVLSFGTAGCNLGCKFCQNWSISKSREIDRLCEQAAPRAIAQAARRLGCKSVAFTYNDPIIWAEYAIDTAIACRESGIATVAVTAGYIQPQARRDFFAHIDAANVDLKAFDDKFYRKLTGAKLQPVLDTLVYLVHETNVWLEITNLIIPGENDSTDDIRRMCRWIREELAPSVPIHFTAFHPAFRLTDRPPTPPAALQQARAVARDEGLLYVYTGNVYDPSGQSTYCPTCGNVVIGRDGYTITHYALDGDRCRRCGTSIAGRFDPAGEPGRWGTRRLPVRIADYAR